MSGNSCILLVLDGVSKFSMMSVCAFQKVSMWPQHILFSFTPCLSKKNNIELKIPAWLMGSYIFLSAGIGSLSYSERMSRLGLTTLHTRRDIGDMIETFKIVTGRVDVEPSIWFTPLTSREGAASTLATSGQWPERKPIMKESRTSSPAE